MPDELDGLSDDELDGIEERASRASGGPWESFIEAQQPIGGGDFIRVGGFDDAQRDMYVYHYLSDGGDTVPVPAADLDFIANARQDVPRLIAEVRRLRYRLGRGGIT